MLRKLIAVLTAAVSLTAFAVLPAAADGPNFEPAIYADGQVFSSKGTADLPAPTDANRHSFDDLYKIINSNNPEGQLAVAEAAPGEQDFNGGRWATVELEWTEEALAAGTVPVLTTDDEVHQYLSSGDLVETGAESSYFQCPLLPVKS